MLLLLDAMYIDILGLVVLFFQANSNYRIQFPSALILAPTRELVHQIRLEASKVMLPLALMIAVAFLIEIQF